MISLWLAGLMLLLAGFVIARSWTIREYIEPAVFPFKVTSWTASMAKYHAKLEMLETWRATTDAIYAVFNWSDR